MNTVYNAAYIMYMIIPYIAERQAKVEIGDGGGLLLVDCPGSRVRLNGGNWSIVYLSIQAGGFHKCLCLFVCLLPKVYLWCIPIN